MMAPTSGWIVTTKSVRRTAVQEKGAKAEGGNRGAKQVGIRAS